MDADVVVGYTAPGDCGPNGQDPPGAKQYVTTGAGYTEMTTELANDYTAWIGSALIGPSAGLTDEQILERLRTDPASPFEVDTCGGVRWTSSRGIDVLLQSLRGAGSLPRESWELTIPVTMHVSDGRVMLYIGGYYVP
jgi:hypothetical protein